MLLHSIVSLFLVPLYHYTQEEARSNSAPLASQTLCASTRLHRRPAGKADRAVARIRGSDRGGLAAVQRGHHDALRLGARFDLLEGVRAAVTRDIGPGKLRGLIQRIALITCPWRRGGELGQDLHTTAWQAHRPDLRG